MKTSKLFERRLFSCMPCSIVALLMPFAIILMACSHREQPTETVDLLKKLEVEGAHLTLLKMTKHNGKNVLAIPAGMELVAYEKIVPGSHLNLEFGILPDEHQKDVRAQFSVEIEPEHGKKEEIYSRNISADRWMFSSEDQKAISLKKYEQKVVRISFRSTSKQKAQTSCSVYWSKCELVSPKRTVEKPLQSARIQQTIKPNVFIYLIDALRADHLETYGYGKPTSKRIKEFAQDSIVFEKAYSQSAWTRASVGTILTGLYPSSHLAEGRLDKLPDFVTTIARELKAQGYSTSAFVTNGNVGPLFNFHRHYDNYMQLGERRTFQIHVQSDELFQRVTELFKQPFRTPGFIYVHATDPHDPYTPAPFFLDIPPDCDQQDSRIVRPSVHKLTKKTHDDQSLKCIIALYDSEIVKADHYFGKFVDLLKEKNLYKNSLVILTSDHGEEFLEHETLKHGKTLYESEIRIPLIVHFPGGPRGIRVKSYARHLDIFPTILDVISAKPLPGVQGTSLLNRVQGENFDGPIFGELALRTRQSKYVILHPYKLLQKKTVTGNLDQLFDLTTDPLEKNDLATKNPIRLGFMRSILRQWSQTQEQRKALLKKPPGAVLDKETEEALRALGYLQ